MMIIIIKNICLHTVIIMMMMMMISPNRPNHWAIKMKFHSVSCILWWLYSGILYIIIIRINSHFNHPSIQRSIHIFCQSVIIIIIIIINGCLFYSTKTHFELMILLLFSFSIKQNTSTTFNVQRKPGSLPLLVVDEFGLNHIVCVCLYLYHFVFFLI